MIGAGAVKGAFGFGMASIAVPVAALFMDARQAVQLMILPTLLGDVLVLGTARRGWRLARPAWAFVVSAVVASVPAAAALNFLPSRTVALMVGFLTVVIASARLVGATMMLSPRAAAVASPIAGTVCGGIIGASGIGAPILAAYLSCLALSPDAMIAAINITFLLMDLARILGSGLSGGLQWVVSDVQLLILVLVSVGVALGVWLRRHTGERSYERALNLFLLFLGLALIWRFIG